MTLPTNPITWIVLLFCCYVGFQLLRLLIGQCLGAIRNLVLIVTPAEYKKAVTNFFFRTNIFMWRGTTVTAFEEIEEKHRKKRSMKNIETDSN